MSFLRNLFSRSPAAYLDRGRRALERGEWAEARDQLELAIARGAGDPAAAEAEPLLKRARAGLVELNRRHAEESAGAGEWQAAVESYDVCIENCDDPDAKRRFEERKHRCLLRSGAARDGDDEAPRGREARWAPVAGAAAAGGGPDDAEPGEGDGPDAGDLDRFELFVGTLAPEAVERFEQEGAEFRRACLLLEDGEGQAAADAFTALMRGRTEDALLLFQRGRARLLAGDLKGAAADLERVRPAWGFAAIDGSGSLHVGLLLAEVYLAQGRPKEAEEVLAAAAAERHGDVEVLSLLGRTRLLREDVGGAGEVAKRLVELAPRRMDGYQLGAEVERARGEAAQAIDLLERGLGACCGKGSACRVKPPDVPATRMLAELYLDQGKRPERVEELIRQVVVAQEGEATWYDHFLRARYFKAIGRTREMGEARGQALGAVPPSRSRERAMLEKLLETHL